jgi:glycosyltransferase involved in cell wall biosynthesis
MEGGGAERQLAYLARALRGSPWQVHVALNHGGPNLAQLHDAGAEIHHLGLRGNHDVRLVHRLMRVMSEVAPDIVQCWLTQMQIAGGAAAVMTGRPWVFSERSSEEAYPRSVKNALRSRMGSHAHAIVSNSAAGDRYWLQRARKGVRRYVIPNGLPLEEIAAAPVATAAQAGVAPGEAFILFAGRLDEQKNAAALVRALGRLRPTLAFRAVLCGEGPLRADLERLIRELGLQSRVRLAGYSQEIWSLMKRANVLVSTSLCEGNPNVVLEAMACHCPLVVSDIPAHLEFLDARCAMIVRPGDPDALARSIESVLENPDTAAERARVAAERSASHALPLIAQHYVGVYSDVLSRRLDPSKPLVA